MDNTSEKTQWYLAEVVLELKPDAADKSLIFINWMLVNATGPDAAYDKATELGAEQSTHDPTLRINNKSAQTRFRGIRNLTPIHGPLEHGTEITFDAITDVSEEQIQKLVTEKSELSVFLQRDDEPDWPTAEEYGL